MFYALVNMIKKVINNNKMNKITIWKSKYDKNIFEAFKSSFLKKEGNYYFVSENFCWEKIIYEENIVEINKNLFTELSVILESSCKNQIQKLSKEPFSIDSKEIAKSKSAIGSVINKYVYKDKYSLFDIITEIFINLLRGYYLTNGNKRLATTFLYHSLWYFGYMFWYISDPFTHNYKIWERKIINFVKLLQQNKDSIEVKNRIKLWIIENTYIAIKWWQNEK